MIIFGITGTLGAGKGTVVKYLEEKGFVHYSARGFITKEIEHRGLSVNRDTMTETANALRAENGPAYIFESLLAEAAKSGGDAIIESIRTVGEARALHSAGGKLIAIDADPKTRYGRITLRASATDNVSYEKFLADEERESNSDDPNNQNLVAVRGLADFVFQNDGTIEELSAQLDKALNV